MYRVSCGSLRLSLERGESARRMLRQLVVHRREGTATTPHERDRGRNFRQTLIAVCTPSRGTLALCLFPFAEPRRISLRRRKSWNEVPTRTAQGSFVYTPRRIYMHISSCFDGQAARLAARRFSYTTGRHKLWIHYRCILRSIILKLRPALMDAFRWGELRYARGSFGIFPLNVDVYMLWKLIND